MKLPHGCGGFTLVELAFVILIVAILAAIAIPSYQDYTVRAQISEGLNMSGTARHAIEEYYEENNALPKDNETAGIAPPTSLSAKYVVAVEVYDGNVIITYGNSASDQISGNTLQMAPSIRPNATIEWQCQSDHIASRHLPAACRG